MTQEQFDSEKKEKDRDENREKRLHDTNTVR